MNTDEAGAVLEEIAPRHLAESWDNVGWQVRVPGQPVTGILLTLDVTPATVEEATSHGLNLIISHHPTLFRPVSSLDLSSPVGSLLDQLLRSRVSVWASHTNLDAAPEGTSFALARSLGMENLSVLARVDRPLFTGGVAGFGAVGNIGGVSTTVEFARRAARTLSSPVCQVAGQPDRQHRRVAVVGGSGRSFLGDVLRSGATLFLTADVRYHDAQEAIARGLDLIVLDHYATEYPILGRVKSWLETRLPGLTVIVSTSPSTPWVDIEL